MITPQIGTFTKCCLRHDNICSVSLPLMYNYMTKPRKPLVVMPVYSRIYAFNLSLHLLFLIALQPQIAHTYSLFSWLKANASKTKEVNLFCLCKLVEPGTAAKRNTKFTIQCIILLLILNVVTWFFVLLLCAVDMHPNPGPQSVSSSSSSSTSSNMSTDVLSPLSLNHNLSFIQYNIQSIVNKLYILQAELFEVHILSFTETWLNPDISTDDLLMQSYNTQERKDRTGDSHGGITIYIKEEIYYKRRNDLEIRGIECIWIELIHNRKHILFGLVYRPPNSDAQYYSNIEDSIALAIDTGIS